MEPRTVNTAHACTLRGCVQLLEIVSCVVALTCSFLSLIWLKEAGGGYVSFSVILCCIFSVTFFIIHSVSDMSGLLRLQTAEWLGYLVGLLLLVIADIVAIRAATLQYFQTAEDARVIYIRNSHISATAVFTTLTSLFYLLQSVLLTTLKLRNKNGAKDGGKSRNNK